MRKTLFLLLIVLVAGCYNHKKDNHINSLLDQQPDSIAYNDCLSQGCEFWDIYYSEINISVSHYVYMPLKGEEEWYISGDWIDGKDYLIDADNLSFTNRIKDETQRRIISLCINYKSEL